LRDVNARHAPNVIFDITMKDTSNIDAVIPKLLEVGYNPKNIHLTWVLTNYAVAIVNNQNRPRVVADDIMLLSHEGAATSMYEVIKGKIPKGLDGGIRVILNNIENTIKWVDPDTKKPMLTKQGNIKVGWIAANVPDTKLTKDMMGVDPELLDNFMPKKT
jgi:hypothetical protein